MFGFGSIFMDSLYSMMLNLCGLVFKYLYRSKSCVVEENGSNCSDDHSEEDDESVSKNLGFQKSRESSNEETECSVFLQSGLISNASKCRVMSGKDLSGFVEEPKTVKFGVHEMFVGLDDCEISVRKDLLEQKKFPEFVGDRGSSSFYFNLLEGSCSVDEDRHEKFDPERGENGHFSILCNEEVHVEREHVEDQESDIAKNDILINNQESDIAKMGILINNQVFDGNGSENWMSDFLDEIDHINTKDLHQEEGHKSFDVENFPEKDEDLDDEYIELENLPLGSTQFDKKTTSLIDTNIVQSETTTISEDGANRCDSETSSLIDANKGVELQEQSNNKQSQTTTLSEDGTNRCDSETSSLIDATRGVELQEQNNIKQSETTTLSEYETNRCDSQFDNDDDDDVLSEHQHLVQQMKMELKNCRIKGLPTISEECESPKVVEDLKPLEIDQKIEYKDIMEEIHKLYKSYSEKMRKLDILNYQTLHAISFVQLKEAEVFKKMAESTPSVLPRIWTRKPQRIYADPAQKSIAEMHRNLELVYVGHMCLSWEILYWLYVKGRELIGHNLEANRSYNRSADDFQQFQVLMQRFIEDEQFKGHRNQSYVRYRCMIRRLLQVPIIKGDCLKAKKERREEADAISLEMLVEIIGESMVVFRDFLFADKKSISVGLKGIRGNKVDVLDAGDSEFLLDIISNVYKKERRIRDEIRSQNCIVKKMKRREERRSDMEILICQVELRLLSRVLSMSKLTTEQLVWCKKKLDNISFVGRKVHIEPSFLLFPF